mgnify:CR=1 FL=1
MCPTKNRGSIEEIDKSKEDDGDEEEEEDDEEEEEEIKKKRYALVWYTIPTHLILDY